MTEAKPIDLELIEAAKSGYLPRVERLLAAGADPKAKDNDDGSTALHWASRYGHTAVVDALLAKDANPNEPDNHGLTPLHWASKSGQLAAVVALLAAKADPNAKDHEGNTPLHEASYFR